MMVGDDGGILANLERMNLELILKLKLIRLTGLNSLQMTGKETWG